MVAVGAGFAKMHMILRMNGAHSPVPVADPNSAFFVCIQANTCLNSFQPTSVNDCTPMFLDIRGDGSNQWYYACVTGRRGFGQTLLGVRG